MFTIFTIKKKDTNISILKTIIGRSLTVLVPAFIMGIRTIYVGADTYNYSVTYQKFFYCSFENALAHDTTSILYYTIEWIICKLTSCNISIYLFLNAFITLYIVISAIDKWHMKNGCFALFIFYCCYGLIIIDQMRQILAASILLYSLWYIYNRRYKVYFILISIASLIHLSVFPIGLIIFVLLLNKISHLKELLFIILIFISSIYVRDIFYGIEFLFEGSKYQMYFSNKYSESELGLGFILTFTTSIIPAIIMYKNIDKKWLNIILLSAPLRMIGYISYFIARMVMYTSIVNVIPFPTTLEQVSEKQQKILKSIIYFCCISYFVLYYCWKSASFYFPYHSVIFK